MNCRKLAKLMPELAAGELDERLSAEAMEHVAGCSSCARELKGYEEALEALSASREMVAVPPGLETLRLPEAAPRLWLRPAMASVGAAVLLLLALLTLPLLAPDKPEAPVPVVVRQQTPPPPKVIQPVIVPEKPAPVKRQVARRPIRRYKAIRAPRIATVAPKAEEATEQPVVMIVSQVEMPSESYSIEIESTDMASGVTTFYALTHDEAQGDQSYQMRTTACPEEEERT